MSVLYKTNSISLDQEIFNYIYKAKHTQQDHLFDLFEIRVRDFGLIQPAGAVVLGVPNARRKPYPLGIAHLGKLSLLSCVTIQSRESTIKDTTGKSPTTSTPWVTHAIIFLCNSLYPTKVSDWPNCLSSQDCAHCSRPFADPYLTSFLSLTLASAEALSWSKPSCPFSLATASPRHRKPQPHQMCLWRSHPTAGRLQSPDTTHRRWLPAPQPPFWEHQDTLEKTPIPKSQRWQIAAISCESIQPPL